jgi:hypothetical protein
LTGSDSASAQAAALDFARRIVPFWHAELGSELLGAYLIGSLAHDGFSERYSDIDMALVAEAGLSPQALDRVRSQAAALSADWGPKLSVFWTDRHFSLGRFPLLDRIDYLDHAVVLMEQEHVRPVRPALEEIQRYLGDAPFANWTDSARRFATAEFLEPKDRKAYLRTSFPLFENHAWLRSDSRADMVVNDHAPRALPVTIAYDSWSVSAVCRQHGSLSEARWTQGRAISTSPRRESSASFWFIFGVPKKLLALNNDIWF